MTSDAGGVEGPLGTTSAPKIQQLTPEYFKSILDAGPTLEHVANAKIAMDTEDPETRNLAAEYWPLLWNSYKKRETTKDRYIVRCSFGQHAAWYIILFSDCVLDYYYPAEIASQVTAKWDRLVGETSAAINELAMIRGRQKGVIPARLFTQQKGVISARLFTQQEGVISARLFTQQKGVISARLFTLLHTLFSVADVAMSPGKQDPAAPGNRLDKTLKHVQSDLKDTIREIRDLARQADPRFAQQWYLIGMLPGLVIVSIMIWAARWLHPLGVTISYLRVVVGGGALGALLSVLVRTTSAQLSSSLQVDTQAGKPLIVSAGAFRPIVGALLALAVYVLIEGGLIPIKIPPDYHDLWFVSGISFLAGFTERFAQDALVNTSRATFGSGSAENPPDVPS